ncbi:hypothetical protein IJJ12_00115 [bacterium]|nr:hypothetical protein [bacterium]
MSQDEMTLSNLTGGKLKLDMDLGIDIKKLPNTVFLMISLVFAAGMIAVIMWLIVPTVQHIVSLRSTIASQNRQLRTYQDRYQAIQTLSQKGPIEKMALVNQILPDDNPFLEVVYSLQQLTRQHHLTVTQLDFTPGYVTTANPDSISKTAASDYDPRFDAESYNVQIEANGTYNDLIAFVSDVETTAPLKTLTSSEIRNNLDGTGRASLVVTVDFHKTDISADAETNIPNVSEKDMMMLSQLSTTFNLPDYNQILADRSVQLRSRTDLFQNESVTLIDGQGDISLESLDSVLAELTDTPATTTPAPDEAPTIAITAGSLETTD